MLTVERGNKQYRIEKLSAIEQFHISRKIAPVLPAILPMMEAMNDGALDRAISGEDSTDMMRALEPLANALADMPDDRSEYILGTCLGHVKRGETENIWASVWVNGQSMFADLQLVDMYFFVFQVLKDSLGNFMQGSITELMSAQSQVSN